ncbi:MAG: hypothetical protein WD077_14980 [Bacteroidia bacterium]
MNKTERNNWKRFLLKLISFVLILVVLDFAFGAILEYFYWNHNGDRYARHLQYTVKEADEDLIIMGSSHAMRSINPAILEQKTGIKSYNAAQAAQSILFHNALLPVLLERHKPSIIVLELAAWELDYMPIHYDRLSFLLPYYKDYSEVRQTVDLRSRFENLKMLSRIYPYNSSILTILQNVLTGRENPPLGNGFDTHPTVMKIDPNEKIAISDSAIAAGMNQQLRQDSLKLAALIDFCQTANKQGTELIVVMTPKLKTLGINSISLKNISKILNAQNIPLLNYSRDPEFLQHPEWFYDRSHLNTEGAEHFSHKLADTLKALINKNSDYTISQKMNETPDPG